MRAGAEGPYGESKDGSRRPWDRSNGLCGEADDFVAHSKEIAGLIYQALGIVDEEFFCRAAHWRRSISGVCRNLCLPPFSELLLVQRKLIKSHQFYVVAARLYVKPATLH